VAERTLIVRNMHCSLWKAALVLLAGWSLPAFGGAVSQEASVALATLLPDGYRTAAIVPLEVSQGGHGTFAAALVDRDGETPERSVRLLSLRWTGRWTVLDTIELTADDVQLAPQYVGGISVVRVGGASLLYVHAFWFGGGSGSEHFYRFYTIASGRLRLSRAFEHGRMERGYLCLRNDRIYDATLVCSRGEKIGPSFVHSCYLDTTEFTFDGESVNAVRRERLEERAGNRFLSDSYRNLSLRSILMRGGHFRPEP
jgi:hypothetical protein